MDPLSPGDLMQRTDDKTPVMAPPREVDLEIDRRAARERDRHAALRIRERPNNPEHSTPG